MVEAAGPRSQAGLRKGKSPPFAVRRWGRLRLPTFRAAGQLRLKRLTLLVDPERRVRAVQFPILDPAASVGVALLMTGHLTMTELRDDGTAGRG